MPIFSYHCPKCGANFDLLLARYDSPAECPKCGADAPERQPSRVGAILSGRAPCAARDTCPAAGGCGCGGHCHGKH